MSEQEIEIWLSEPQTAVLETRQQLILEMSGQGGGKSQSIGYSSGQLIAEFPEVLGFIGANTYLQLSQSTLDRVFKTWKADKGFEEWDPKSRPWGAYVVDKKPPAHFVRLHQLRDYAGTISFYNGQLTFIGSLENYKAHEGKEFGWAHLDETKDTKEKALKEVILGRLRQRGLFYSIDTWELFYFPSLTADEAERRGLRAWNPLYIHTSPAIDGAEWLLKMFKLDKFERQIKKACQAREKDFFHKEFENKAVIIYSAYHNKENLAPDYLQNQELNLGEEGAILKLVDGYPFGQAGNAWFWAFRRDKHIRPVPYLPGVPVSLMWDFNSVPYMTCLCCQIENLIRYIDAVGNKFDEPAEDRHAIEVMRLRFYREYCFGGNRNTTEAICTQFAQDHDPASTEVFYYGDASGLHRIPGLGSLTNYKIIEQELQIFMHNESKKVRDPNMAPLKRRDLMNDIFRGKYPNIEIWIDEEMEKFIEDCENVKIGASGKIKPLAEDPDTKKKFEKWGHTSDAAECGVSEICRFVIEQ